MDTDSVATEMTEAEAEFYPPRPLIPVVLVSGAASRSGVLWWHHRHGWVFRSDEEQAEIERAKQQ